jgi:urease accessory protein
VGVDVDQMVLDASAARDSRTVIALSRTDPASIVRVRQWVLDTLAEFRAGSFRPRDPGPMAPHAHADGVVHAHPGDLAHSHSGDEASSTPVNGSRHAH